MSDEPEIPVPPEPTTHVLKALLAQKESLNRAINKPARNLAPSTAPQAPPVPVFDDCDQYAEDSPDPGQPF